MKKIQMDDEKATVILLVTLILALACVYVYVEFLYKPNNTQIIENNPNESENGEENQSNSEEIKDSDTSKIVIEKESLTIENSVTKLITKVTNDSGDFENLNYTVKLIAQDDTVLKELNLFVGDLYKYQIKYVDSYIDGDYTNIKEVSYELVK